jgi:hypothetical protein
MSTLGGRNGVGESGAKEHVEPNIDVLEQTTFATGTLRNRNSVCSTTRRVAV